MMNFYNNIINHLNKVYRIDEYVESISKAIAEVFETLSLSVDRLKNNFFFDTLNLEGVEFFEKLLKITPSNLQTLADRKSTIQAKWLSRNHNCIDLIQKICDAWKNGEVEADFKNGKIYLKFVGQFGIPVDIDTLFKAVGEIKPAHLGIYKEFKYLLIENIHKIKTIEQMETLTLEMFAFGGKEA